jgi:hypothetical protein
LINHGARSCLENQLPTSGQIEKNIDSDGQNMTMTGMKRKLADAIWLDWGDE